MEAERREDLIALIQKVRDGEPLRVDASVALRMITVRVKDWMEGFPGPGEDEQTLAVFSDILDIIGRADATEVVGDDPGPWGCVDEFHGR